MPGRAESEIFAGLEMLRRSMGTARVAQGALRGLAVGAVVGATVLVLLHGSPATLPIAAGITVLGAVVGGALGLRSWPQLIDAARTADSHYGLQNRMATAVELRESTGTFALLQRRDLLEHLGGRRVDRAHGRLLRWRDTAVPALTVAAFLVLLFGNFPASPEQRSASAATDNRRIHRVVSTKLPPIISKVNKGLTPEARQSEAVRKLNQALARLQHQLQGTSTRANALRTISATQSQLRHIASTLHPVSTKAVAQLNSSLARYGSGHTGSHQSSNAQIAQAARTLNHLAASLSHMTSAQRAALARALLQASAKSPDAGMRSSLQQAASSLAYGDQASAAQSLRTAAQAVNGTPSAKAALSRLSAAGNQLDSLKGAMVASSGQSAGESGAAGGKGASGSGQGSGKGGKSGSGQGSGKGNGSGHGSGSGKGSGKGSGQGQGAGQGSGHGSGQGTGSPGGHGTGGGQGGAGPRGQGRYATVYAPGKQGKGTHTIQTGPTGAPEQVPLVPYRQVLARYIRTAHSSLDSGSVPAGRQQYVRRYFSAISQ